jgi:hypothetical protein
MIRKKTLETTHDISTTAGIDRLTRELRAERDALIPVLAAAHREHVVRRGFVPEIGAAASSHRHQEVRGRSEGFHEAREWLELASTKKELERLCQESRANRPKPPNLSLFVIHRPKPTMKKPRPWGARGLGFLESCTADHEAIR